MSTRRSARLEFKPTLVFSEGDTVDSDGEYAEENLSDVDNEGRVRKKRKKTGASSRNTGQSGKNVKGRRGRLRALPEMPLDILYEIFGHLRPYDILRLSRTTKALRGILMTRSATSVWKDARSNIEGLPDCPQDLTEPQYAGLAFDPFCHLCGAPNVHTILWACRLRSCQKCINSMFTGLSDAMYRVEISAGGLVRARAMLPFGQVKIGKYSQCQDRPRLDQFVEERTESVVMLTQHANLCESWHQNMSMDRQEQLQDLKERRKEAIFDKLRQSGWGEELDKNDEFTLTSLTEHASVRKPQELTDRIWSNIRQPLFDILKEIRRERLEMEQFARLRKRAKVVVALLEDFALERPINEVIPGPADVCDMDEFKTVIEDTPDDVEVTQESFKQAMERLPHLITQWRSAKDAELVRIMSASASAPTESQLNESQPENNRALLELATTFFHCKSCSGMISYPRILVHSCTHVYSWRHREVNDPRYTLWGILTDVPWNLGGDIIGIKEGAKESGSLVVKSCGLDPDTASTQEMDNLDARFECESCVNSSGRLIMEWRMAVQHGLTRGYPDHGDSPAWKVLNEADNALVKQDEKEKLKMRMGSFCARCRKKTFYIPYIAHLKELHRVEELAESDYDRPLDEPLPTAIRFWQTEVASK
ncbi:hypothetical protein PILCRDRAFT_549999 [Piloderma croceum F 1598]|uniref:F-box domain-containing protein n=1 Tax=Piloderma croceum (strain F 1598) TaxID=765440 RepID=A0A0C3FJL4_PILCF|nr:hypothetical protein PILCRDRAFT_549999 [Piloderma croceum F 1598]